MEIIFLILGLLLTPIFVLIIRALYLIYVIFTTDCKLKIENRPLRTVLCVGSGGHTTELLRLLKYFDNKKYRPRLYISAYNDLTSDIKIHEHEKSVETEMYSICKIPRSRNVHQSYTSSIITSLNAIVHTVPFIYNFKPDIIICNGPGTCIPVCIVAFVFRCFYVLDCRIVFVESICRVRTLSLTGKLLQYFADIVVVQWPQLREVCFRAKYFGRLT